MKTLRALFAIAILLFTLVGPAGGQAAGGGAQIAASVPSASAGHNSSGGHLVYLPTVINGQSSSSSFDLIDQDIASGKLSAEQGLIYKVFAQFSDARLPPQYLGSGPGREGDRIMEDVISYNAAYTLTQTAKNTLIPFFIPPDDPRSWFYLSKMQAAGQAEAEPQATPASWLKVTTANNKVDIFWLDSRPADAAKAAGLKAAFDGTIWKTLTELMKKEPMPDGSAGGKVLRIYLWNSYVDSDGTTVPFKRDILGITVGTQCDRTASVIYMPDRLTLDVPGLIQYATHEFMHAIQFAYTIQSCPKYRWLKEATATWAEDYVYKDAQSEQDTAKKFLNRPSVRLDDRNDMHDYGAYLLPYYLTHTVDPTASVIRLMWENAATTANSYKAVDDAVNTAQPSAHDWYWAWFLESLWNKSPFEQYYKNNDKLTDSVAQAGVATIQVSAAGGESIIPLPAQIPTGGALFFHLAVDDSVSSLTILNGLSYKLKTGAAWDAKGFWGTVALDPADEAYIYDDLSAQDAQGATLELLMKTPGYNWQLVPMVIPGVMNTNQNSFCLDVQGKIEDMVVILSNADFQNPDRIMKQQGIPTTIFANNVPCWKITGTSKVVNSDGGIVETVTGSNVTYGYGDTPGPYGSLDNVFPEIDFSLLNADAAWSISGTDVNNCVYAGSGFYHVGMYSNNVLGFVPGVLLGSPTHRGYAGQGNPNEGDTVSYTVTCPDPPSVKTETKQPLWFFAAPLYVFRDQIRVNSDGTITGSYQHTDGAGDWTWEWNFVGIKK